MDAKIAIAAEDPREKDGVALIAALDAELSDIYEPQFNFFLGAEALAKPGSTFLVARDGAGAAVGCVAVRAHEGYAEIKRMFVTEASRGTGVADALLAAAHQTAAAQGLTLVKLETGDRQVAARRLYERSGYQCCSAFADYPEGSPHNLFYEIRLAPETMAVLR